MKMLKHAIFALVIILAACSDPSGGGKSEDGKIEGWSTVDDKKVYYAEEHKGFGGYGFSHSEMVEGSGSIVVDVWRISGPSSVPFGFKYEDPDHWSRQFSFKIETTGEYLIGWVDEESGLSGYDDTDWIKSDHINTGLNQMNTLKVDYNSTTKTYKFFINDHEVLTKTFNWISRGELSYYCELKHDASPDNPYEFAYRTRSPYTHP